MFNHDRAVKLIRAAKGAHGLRDKDLSRETGLSRTIINLYLNRKINLIQSDVEKVFSALGIEDFLPILSAPSNRPAREMQLEKVLEAEGGGK